MRIVDDLFDYRDIVGCKLEQLINARDYTKSGVCAGAGISRPTLDKLLSGDVTNRTNFEKHISKLLAFLGLSTSELMGGVEHPYASQKQLRKALNIDLERLSRESGVSVETLRKIEAGEDAPLAELRDIAYCLRTGVRGVLGDDFFQTQLAHIDYFVENGPTAISSPGGFWGHFGILVKGHPKYMWFPITLYTRNLIYRCSNDEYMAVPCMDNSLLLINCEHIEELVLLDEACDQPADMDWNSSVSCGEIPAVIYEAFDDYMSFKYSEDDPSKYDLSESLVTTIDKIIAEFNLDPEVFAYDQCTAVAMLASGQTTHHSIPYGDAGNLTIVVRQISEAGELFEVKFIELEDESGAEVLINIKNVSMLKLPLAMTSTMIAEEFKELLADLEG